MSKAQLGRLIELPDEALQQVLDYASTLSKAAAADHFANLLGDAPAAVEFVAAFNARRQEPAAAAAAATAAGSAPGPAAAGSTEPVAKHPRARKKKAAPLHTPPPRPVSSLAPPPGTAYHKKDVGDDYMGGGRSSGASTPRPAAAGASIRRGATPVSAATTPPRQPSPPRRPASPARPQRASGAAGGSLIQDALAPKPAKGKAAAAAAAKISITGGTAMHGAATVLADFDAAIRSLEVSTNPTLSGAGGADGGADNVAARRCNCVATRHPLQTAAPSCRRCGKVVCVKEGLGPCTFCGTPLLSPAEVQAMIRALRAERGREKMAADREAHRRPDQKKGGGGSGGAATPHMIAGHTKWGGDDDGFVSLAEAAAASRTAAAAADPAEAKARAHRDKLLAFQAQNTQRTTVRDEAADMDVGDALAGGDAAAAARDLWATPEERARALRRQQKLLREMEWNARPAYEKRQQVLSIDVTGRKVFRKVVAVERPPTPASGDEDGEDDDDAYGYGYGYGYDRPGVAAATVAAATDADSDPDAAERAAGGGALSRNPLLGHLIKPVYDARGRARAAAAEAEKAAEAAAEEDAKGTANSGDNTGTKKEGAGSGKGPAQGKGKAAIDDTAPLPGRKDDPTAASRWRRVQDDLDSDAGVVDGGGYRADAADEPACG